jgi:hypothetical protein
VTLPFDVKIDVPLSALCPRGVTGSEGHLLKIVTFGRKKERRLLCVKCKQEITYEAKVGLYVTPYVIPEMPY